MPRISQSTKEDEERGSRRKERPGAASPTISGKQGLQLQRLSGTTIPFITTAQERGEDRSDDAGGLHELLDASEVGGEVD